MIELSIITINYNGLAVTTDLLNSIRDNLNGFDYECLVLDNGSKVDESVQLKESFPEYFIFRSEKNLGFAGGNNYCIQLAKGRYLYFINNDTLFVDDSVKLLINYLDLHPEIGASSPKIMFQNPVGTVQFAGFTSMSRITLRNKGIGYLKPDLGQFETPTLTHFLHGAAMMVSRTALEKSGLMPDVYFLYYEELDWSEAFKRNGFELWYLPVSTIIHREGQSVGSGSPLKQYYMTRNRLLFAKRNRNWFDFTVFAFYYLFIVCAKDMLTFLVKGQTRHVRAVFIGMIDFLIHRYGARYIK